MTQSPSILSPRQTSIPSLALPRRKSSSTRPARFAPPPQTADPSCRQASRRLNLFQRMALHWDTLHPYNAAQCMRLASEVDPQFAADAWNGTLRDLGLGSAHIKGNRYQHAPGVSELNILPSYADPQSFLSAEMNRPFDLTTDSPFRAFVIPDSSSPLLGIVYHHWVADSVSIRLLLREWLFRIVRWAGARTTAFPQLPDCSRLAGLLRLPASLVRLASFVQASKEVRRLPEDSSDDLSVGFHMLPMPDHFARHLHLAAAGRNAKVTDLLLCTLAQVCHRHLPASRRHRRGIALGTVRDLRPMLKQSDEALGVSLGFGSTICPENLLDDRDRLLSHITAAGRRHRTPSAVHAGNLNFGIALSMARWIDPQGMREFYRKFAPYSGGLSNVDLSHSWVADCHPDYVSEFFRVSPTGPMLPIVITPTTLPGRFSIAMTYRKSVFNDYAIRSFADDLRQDLHAWLPRSASPELPARSMVLPIAGATAMADIRTYAG